MRAAAAMRRASWGEASGGGLPDRRPRRPPDPFPDEQHAGRDENGAYQHGVEQDADRDRHPDLGDGDGGYQREGRERRGHHDACGGDHAAGDAEAAQGAHPDAEAAGFLADPGGQEDVVVDSQRDEEDEHVHGQLGLDAVEAEYVAPQQAGQPEGGREAERGGGDQQQRGHDRLQQQADDHQDHGEYQRDQQQRGPGGGLGDVVLHGRVTAQQGAGGAGVQPLAQVRDRGVPGGAVRRHGQGGRVADIAADRAGRRDRSHVRGGSRGGNGGAGLARRGEGRGGPGPPP